MSNPNLPSKDVYCHQTKFEKKCFDLVTDGKCMRWTCIQGLDPQTGEQLHRWDCIDNLTPILLIEIARQQGQTGSAIESFRNEMVALNDQSYRMITKQ